MMSEETTTRLRQWVDGELSPEDGAALERELAGNAKLAAAAEAERRLHSKVADVLGEPAMPAATRERIMAALRGASDERVAEGREPVAVVGSPDTEPARRFSRMNAFAVAASLLLVATAVLVGIFGPSVDQIRPAVDPVGQIMGFAATSHHQGLHQPAEVAAAAASEALSEALGEAFDVQTMAIHGYEYLDYRTWDSPAGNAIQILYKRALPTHGRVPQSMRTETTASDGCPMAVLSVFVFPDGPRLGNEGWVEAKADNGQSVVGIGGRRVPAILMVCCHAPDIEPLSRDIARVLPGR